MNPTQFVLILVNPYEDDEVDQVVGPFASKKEAQDAKEALLKAGEHPDAGFFILPITSLQGLLDELHENLG